MHSVLRLGEDTVRVRTSLLCFTKIGLLEGVLCFSRYLLMMNNA